MKRLFVQCVLVLCIANLCTSAADAAVKRVALFGTTLNVKTHAIVEQGFIDRLAKTNYKISYNYAYVKSPLNVLKEINVKNPDIQFDIYSSDADKNAEVEILKTIKNKNYDIIVSVGGPTALAVKNAGIDNVPVVFFPTIQPQAIGLVNDMNSSGNNFTGVANNMPMSMEFDVLKQVVPDAKKVGIVQSLGEPQLEPIIKEALLIKNKFGIKNIIIIPVTAYTLKPDEAEEVVAKAAQKLVDKKVDAIFIPGGVITGSQASKGMIDIANAHKIPTISYNLYPVGLGATVGVVSNAELTGNLGAEIFIKVLKGIPPTEIPVGMQIIPDIIVNLKAAKQAGIKIPQDVLEKATKVIE